MAARSPKHVVLILAREFATRLATPVFVTDAAGNLVFFNEPAEEVLGQTFGEAGEIGAEQWESLFQIEDMEGRPMALERIPGGIALLERRPAHCNLRITALDGRKRSLFVTAFPLLSRGDELQGTVSVFWEEPGQAAPSPD